MSDIDGFITDAETGHSIRAIRLPCVGGSFDGLVMSVVPGYAFYVFDVPKDLPIIPGVEYSIEDKQREVYTHIDDALVFRGIQ